MTCYMQQYMSTASLRNCTASSQSTQPNAKCYRTCTAADSDGAALAEAGPCYLTWTEDFVGRPTILHVSQQLTGHWVAAMGHWSCQLAWAVSVNKTLCLIGLVDDGAGS